MTCRTTASPDAKSAATDTAGESRSAPNTRQRSKTRTKQARERKTRTEMRPPSRVQAAAV